MKYIDADRLREKIAEQMESLPREVGRGNAGKNKLFEKSWIKSEVI